MTQLRQGRCTTHWSAGLALIGLCTLAGCDGAVPTSAGPAHTEAKTSPSSAPLADRWLETPDEARGSAVVFLAWGDTPRSPVLFAAWANGVLAAYRPLATPSPIATGVWPDSRGAHRVLIAVGPESFVTGDETGLGLWRIESGRLEPVHAARGGAVGDLAMDPRSRRDLIVGLADGRLQRFRIVGDDPLSRPIAESRSSGPSSAVRSVRFDRNGTRLLVLRDSGRLEERPASLDAPASIVESSLEHFWDVGGQLVGQQDGHDLRTFDLPAGQGPQRVGLADPLVSASADAESGLLIGAQSARLLFVQWPRDRVVSPSEMRYAWPRAPDQPAWSAVSAAPDGSGLVAAGAASGGLRVASIDEVLASSTPISPDEIPSVALHPERRFFLSRPGRPLDAPPGLRDAFQSVRDRLSRGRLNGLGAEIQALESDPAAGREAAAEAIAARAALQQSEGWSHVMVERGLGPARESFEVLGRHDRLADLEMWRGLLLAPPFDGSDPANDPGRLEQALASFRRVVELDEGPTASSSGRLGILARAMVAWTLLAMDRPEAAQRVHASVRLEIDSDAVLSRVPELDRVAIALASARGDLAELDRLTRRALERASADDPPSLRLEFVRERLGLLAARGDWAEAQSLFDRWPEDDLERGWRLAVVRRLSGSASPDPRTADDPDPSAAPLAWWQAFPNLADKERALAALDRAAEGARRLGRNDLVVEAQLLRAEFLERAGALDAAIADYRAVAESSAIDPRHDRTRGFASPLRWLGPRACRGLARCQIAANRGLFALRALEWADALATYDTLGAEITRAHQTPVDPSGPDELRLEWSRAWDRPGALPGLEGPDLDDPLRHAQSRAAAHASELSLGRLDEPADVSEWAGRSNEATLSFHVIGPGTLAGCLLRRGVAPEWQVIRASRADLREASRRWRAGLGDGGRPGPITINIGPDRLIGPLPEPEYPIQGSPALLDSSTPPDVFLRAQLLDPFLKSLDGVESICLIPGEALAAVPADLLLSSWPAPHPRVSHHRPFPQPRARRAALAETSAPATASLLVGDDPAQAIVLSRLHRGTGWHFQHVSSDGLSRSSLAHRVAEAGRLVELSLPRSAWSPNSVAGSPEICLSESSGATFSIGDVLGVRADGHSILLVPPSPPRADLSDAGAIPVLATAWIAAGADSVVICLWDPPAPSRIAFSEAFQRALAAGLAVSAALDTARGRLARDSRWSDPVHWAGYVLYQPD